MYIYVYKIQVVKRLENAADMKYYIQVILSYKFKYLCDTVLPDLKMFVIEVMVEIQYLWFGQIVFKMYVDRLKLKCKVMLAWFYRAVYTGICFSFSPTNKLLIQGDFTQ